MPTIRTYIYGYGLSILLTLMAFGLVWQHELSGHVSPSHTLALWLLIILAVVQLVVQLVFFLHVAQEQKPRWNFVALAFAFFIVVVVVGGTLWIMHNLNHMQMSDEQIFESEAIVPHEHNHEQ